MGLSKGIEISDMNRRDFIAANLATSLLSWLPGGFLLASPPNAGRGLCMTVDKFDGTTQLVTMRKGWRKWSARLTPEETADELERIGNIDTLTLLAGIVTVHKPKTVVTIGFDGGEGGRIDFGDGTIATPKITDGKIVIAPRHGRSGQPKSV